MEEIEKSIYYGAKPETFAVPEFSGKI